MEKEKRRWGKTYPGEMARDVLRKERHKCTKSTRITGLDLMAIAGRARIWEKFRN
jgi:hypothetical protein